MIWRTYSQAGAHPTTWGQFRAWGPTNARFDHHLPPPCSQSREILYGAIGADAAATTIAEVFQETRTVDRVRDAHTWVAFATVADLRLLDLTGNWPTRAGASIALGSGPRPRARRWSVAIYDAYPEVDGLTYPSSMNRNEPSVALYERARRAMPRYPVFNRTFSDPAVLGMLKNVCAPLGYLLV
ncbi:MAG: RES family NAD+ phosphorylase [Holophaga sp.]|nr:RES family NAD+ phosphorylase [Holophaga sp.]